MKRFRSHRLYAPVVAVTLMAFVASCTHWEPAPLEPAQLPRGGTVRATLRSGEQVTARSPVISGDTLRSGARGVPSGAGIRFSDLSRIEVEKTDSASSVVAVVVGVVVLAVVAVAVAIRTVKVDLGCVPACN